MDVELADIWNLPDGSDTALAFSRLPSFLSQELIDEAAVAKPASSPVWRLAWSMRRLLWHGLLESSLLDVIMRHDATSGLGSGTLVFTAVPDQHTMTMTADDFDRSDAMHMAYSDTTGWFGWPEYRLANLEYEELDDVDLFEHSFSSVDQVVAVCPRPESLGPGWQDTAPESQEAAVRVLLGDLAAQVAEFGEIVTDHRDIVLAVALHPGTAAEVRAAVSGTNISTAQLWDRWGTGA